MKPFRLSRRAVLRGAGGVAIALPWLEAMGYERTLLAAPAPARRFVAVYQPGGTILEQWTPTGTETSFTLSPILAPFEARKDDIVVLSGIDMQSAQGGTDSGGMVAWLTGTGQVGGTTSGYAKGPSIDQVLAGRLSAGLRIPSLPIAVRWGTGRCHGVVHPFDITSYEAADPYLPVPPRLDPLAIWNDVFGGDGTALAWERSILDVVDRRYARLAARLGAADRERLEQHLTSVRELEQRLIATGGNPSRACTPPALLPTDLSGYDPASGLNSADDGSIRDLETDAAIPNVGKLMMDMLVMALACDITAVGTMQWTDTECKHTLPWLNLPETHRFYMNDGGFRPVECQRIATWYSEQHAYLLGRMAEIDMGGHTLLDETVVFFGSHIQHPANYAKNSMPFVLAGRGGGLRAGRWVRYPSVSHNDLLVSILRLCGGAETRFGDSAYSTGPLTNLV